MDYLIPGLPGHISRLDNESLDLDLILDYIKANAEVELPFLLYLYCSENFLL
jgi:hypothetical protein